jgi:hypothetical protein
MQSRVKVRAIGNVQSDDRRIARTFHPAVVAGDGEHPYPRHIAGQIAQDPIAVRCIERHLRVDARRYAEQRARRFDNLALRGDTAAREIDDLIAGNLGALEAGSFQPAHAVRP